MTPSIMRIKPELCIDTAICGRHLNSQSYLHHAALCLYMPQGAFVHRAVNAELPVQASQTASLPPTPVLLDTSSKVEGLARKHAAEVASLREAFHARLAALEEELQVHILSSTY